MPVNQTYYSLLACYDGQWAVQFGDYDREVVKAEQDDWFDSEPETQTTILKSGDSQEAIDAGVARLNSH